MRSIQPKGLLPPLVTKPVVGARRSGGLETRLMSRRRQTYWFKRHYLPAAFAKRDFVFGLKCRGAVFGAVGGIYGPFIKKRKERVITVLHAGPPSARVRKGRVFGPAEVRLGYYEPGKVDEKNQKGTILISAGTRPPTLAADRKGNYVFTIYGVNLRGAKKGDARLPAVKSFVFTAGRGTDQAESLETLASRLIPFVRALNSRKFLRHTDKGKKSYDYADATGGDSGAALEKLCHHYIVTPRQACGWIVPRSKVLRKGEMALGRPLSVGFPDLSQEAANHGRAPKPLGRGEGGVVYLAWILPPPPAIASTKVALKIDLYYKESQSLRANFRAEVSNSFALSYPSFGYSTRGFDGMIRTHEIPGANRVARTLGYNEDGKTRGMLVTELVHGDLKRFVFDTTQVPIASVRGGVYRFSTCLLCVRVHSGVSHGNGTRRRGGAARASYREADLRGARVYGQHGLLPPRH